MPITENDIRDNPVVWFTRMTIEANRGYYERAAMAKQELERLGVFICFKGKNQRRYKKAERVLAKRSRRETFLAGASK